MGFDAIVILLFLGIPIFFLCKFFFKGIKTDRTRWIVTALATVVITPVIYVGLICAYIAWVSYYPERKFDRERWRTDIETRYEMTDDLIEHQQLVGKTKEEVLYLLGPEGELSGSAQWSYYIGFKPGLFAIDPSILVIEFSEGKVSNCWVRQT